MRDPVRTLKIAGPLGLGICAVLYMLANISYFACVYFLGMLLSIVWSNFCADRASTTDEIAHSGVTVAALFFKNVFGEEAQRALAVFVALRWVWTYHVLERYPAYKESMCILCNNAVPLGKYYSLLDWRKCDSLHSSLQRELRTTATVLVCAEIWLRALRMSSRWWAAFGALPCCSFDSFFYRDIHTIAR